MKYKSPYILFTLALITALFKLKTVRATLENDFIVVSSDEPYSVMLYSEPQHPPIDVKLHSDNRSVGFYVIHVHSQRTEAVISFTKDSFLYGTYSDGKDAGLVLSSPNSDILHTYCRAERGEARAVLIPISYPKTTPIPGACCTVCSLEADATLTIKHLSWYNSISFARANVYGNDAHPIPCDSISGPAQTIQTYRLEYTFYVLYFGDQKNIEGDLFEALWKMSTPSLIKKHAQQGDTFRHADLPEVKAVFMQGQGVVYNVIVKDPLKGTEAAYIPVHSYGCNVTDVNSCLTSYSAVPWQLAGCVIGSLVGIVMCFLGHKLMTAQIFLGSTIAGGVVAYLVIDWFSDWVLLEKLACSLAAGAALGCLFLLLWTQKKLLHLCLIPNALVLCLLLNCVVFFSYIGTMPVWHQRTAYWLTVTAIIFLPSIFLIMAPKFLSILNTSVLGSYGFIVMISFFVRCNLGYIVLNFFLEASSHTVFVGRPFSKVDSILCGIWACLGLAGIIVQYYTSKPKRRRRGSERRRDSSRRRIDERTRLLQDEDGVEPPARYQSINSSVNVI